jgi:signal transduction histidine kinase
MSTRAKAITAVMLVILTICAIFLTLLARQNQQYLQEIIDSKAQSTALVAEAIIRQTSSHYTLRIEGFLNYQASSTKEAMVAAFARRDRDQLLAMSRPFLQILHKENPYFSTLGWILPDNTAFLRVHDPENFGQDVSAMRPDIAAVNKDRRQRSGFTTGYVGLQYRVVQPVFYQGAYLGALQMGIRGEALLDALARELNNPVGLAIPNGEYQTIRPQHRKGLHGPTHTIESSHPDLFQEIIAGLDWQQARQTVRRGDNTYILCTVSSLTSFQGREVGLLFVALDITAEVAQGHSLLLVTLLYSALLIALSFGILYFSYGSLVQKISNLNLSLAKSNLELEKRVEERTQTLLSEIAERKNAETKLQKAERMEAIGLMASGVAHDLNNILSGIVSYPELLLLQLPDDSELRRPIATIHESGLRAAAVVADLLTVARGAAKVREVTQVNAIVHDYLVSPEGQKLLSLYPGVRIKTELAPELAHIFCSPVHVRKCLMNLVINAAEALGANGAITIATENRPTGDQAGSDHVALLVRDNGPGIPAADLDHIFEPFYTKKKMGRSGTGIGLAVVWSTMQDHDGRVRVESTEQGTTFTLLFPATRAPKKESARPVSPRELRGNGEHILVVDDEPHQRDIASQLLTILGYQVSTAASGTEAIAAMAKAKADVLLLDMLMEPGINGRQTYEKILKIHPGQKAIIASGFSESDEVKKALQLGAGVFIKKPYTLQDLGLAVKKALQG